MRNKADKLRAMTTEQPSLSLEAADAYNDETFAPGMGRTMKARPIPLTDILPDPAQPRRAVPSQARAVWDGKSNASSIHAMLLEWLRLAELELGERLEIYIATEPPEGYKRPEIDEEQTPIAYKLLKLVDDTNDIFANGLNLPIRVFSLDEGKHRIEQGERRWLAHWWLSIVTRDARWTRINAFLCDDFSVWRQASENGARQGLNAIAKARQLALLLLDVYHKEQPFRSFEEVVRSGVCDRAYYAQVADGEEFRIPKGTSTRFLAAMGLGNADQLRHYRALLRLPDEIWIQGDDENWSERALRHYTVTSGNGKTAGQKPRDLNEAEKEFSYEVRTALVSLQHNEFVREDVIAKIEAFCKYLRDTRRVKSFTEKR